MFCLLSKQLWSKSKKKSLHQCSVVVLIKRVRRQLNDPINYNEDRYCALFLICYKALSLMQYCNTLPKWKPCTLQSYNAVFIGSIPWIDIESNEHDYDGLTQQRYVNKSNQMTSQSLLRARKSRFTSIYVRDARQPEAE